MATIAWRPPALPLADAWLWAVDSAGRLWRGRNWFDARASFREDTSPSHMQPDNPLGLASASRTRWAAQLDGYYKSSRRRKEYVRCPRRDAAMDRGRTPEWSVACVGGRRAALARTRGPAEFKDALDEQRGSTGVTRLRPNHQPMYPAGSAARWRCGGRGPLLCPIQPPAGVQLRPALWRHLAVWRSAWSATLPMMVVLYWLLKGCLRGAYLLFLGCIRGRAWRERGFHGFRAGRPS